MDKKPQESASREADKFIVRLPDGMRERIAESAKLSGRSMNAEMVARLMQSFDPQEASGRHVGLLIDRYEADLAEAELDKHILYLMLAQVAFDQRVVTQTVRVQKDTPAEVLKTFNEWETETRDLLNEAEEKLSGSLAEATQRFSDACDRLLKSMQYAREDVAKKMAQAEALAAKELPAFPPVAGSDPF